MKQILIILSVFTVAVSLTLIFIYTNANAWHQYLGIDDNKAAELYQTNPNDPAIVQWKNAMQLAINQMDKCFDTQWSISCESLYSNITSNCKSHPNTLLSCNDARLVQFPLELKAGREEVEQQLKQDQEREQARLKFQECLKNGGSSMTC